MFKHKKLKAISIALLTLLTSLNVYSVPANAAGTETLFKTANVEYNTVEATLRSHQSVFYKKKVITTKPIVLDAGTGKIITKIVLKKDGQPIQTIPVNAKTYNKTLTLDGEGVPVKSIENTPYGTWIAWSRSIAGTSWIPSTSTGWDWGITGNSNTGSETIGGVVKDAWPGKTVYMNLPYTRNKAYESIGPVNYGTFATTYIDDENLGSFNPFQPGINVVLLKQTMVNGTEASGMVDDSTVLTGMEVIDLNTAKIRFTQNYDHEGTRVKLGGNGAAAMMYYFANYTFDIKSFTYRYPDTYEVYIKDDDGTTIPGPDPDPGTTPVPPSCTTPAAGQSIIGKFMDPVVTAKILADRRGSEQFDVLQGIPTSESLYGNVFSRNYLYQDKFVQMTGTCTFTVAVNQEYTLKWDPKKDGVDATGKPIKLPDPQEETESKTYQYQIERPYSFWKVDNLEVYKIEQASLVNYALPNGGIIIQPSGYTAPTYAASTNGYYYPPSPPDEVDAPMKTVPGGTTRPSVPNDESSLKSVAEKVVEKVDVENDSLKFNGQTIMNNSRVKEVGPTPSQIPEPQSIGENVLYSPGNMISSSKVNRKDTPSSGVIKYPLMPGNINGGSDQQFSINGINTVTVHTPVVDYSSVTDDQEHNQKTTPNYSRSALILDRPFSVTIPTVGQHQSYKNYGYRDYRKWTKDRQVQFEFGVLSRQNDNSSYIPPGTWVSFPDGVDTLTFYMPVWVDEGDYNVYTRAIAENAPTGFTTETDANMNWTNHVATRTLEVEVIGRVYDFRVTDIADFNWETVFRTSAGSSLSNGKVYPVGDKGIDGDPNGISFPYELPIRRGSHPNSELKNVAVKTGYHFKFDLKSKGNMFGTLDSIRITPTFTFVDTNGNRQPVDLYYNTDNQKFIQIGSSADVQKRYVTLDSRLRNVSKNTLQQTGETLYDLFANSSGWSMTRTQYTTSYLSEAQKKTYIGGYDVELITAPLRTFIGGFSVPTGVSAPRKNAAIQQWYGEYSLPASPYVVKKGTNIAEYGRKNKLNDNSSIFLKKGFIVVNFDIETIRNGDLNKPHLQYINTGIAKANQWKREGFNYQFTDPYGMKVNLTDGDVIFYNADKSSYDDFGQSGTH